MASVGDKNAFAEICTHSEYFPSIYTVDRGGVISRLLVLGVYYIVGGIVVLCFRPGCRHAIDGNVV